MMELVHTLQSLITEVDAGRPAALCVVVKTAGSTPQIPGATMLVRRDSSIEGTVGGGNVEAEVCKKALRLIPQNVSELAEFDFEHNEGWDDASICGGRMWIAIATFARPLQLDSIRAAVSAANRRETTSFPLTVTSHHQTMEYRIHIEVPPTLLIAGAGHVAQAVARLAVDLDFRVIVMDDRADMASQDRFPSTVQCRVGNIAQTLRDYALDESCYVVIVTRGHRHDAEALDAVIRRPSAYVGMIGSRRKSGIVLQRLADSGVPEPQLRRVHTPIGLPIKAFTVNEIAVSILAELIQTRRQIVPKLVECPSDASPLEPQ